MDAFFSHLANLAAPDLLRPLSALGSASLPGPGESGDHAVWAWLLAAACLLLLGIAAGAVWSRQRLVRNLRGCEAEIEQALRQWNLDRRLALPQQPIAARMATTVNRVFERFHDRWRTSENQRRVLEAVMFSMIEGVLAVDQGERLIRINQAAANVLRVNPEWALGRSIQEVVRNASVQALIVSVLRTGEPAEEDIVLYMENEGRPGVTVPRFLQVHVNRLDDLSGAQIGALLVFSDVTRLRHLEAMRTDFVANVSHEVRTPLTAIKGAVETILDAELHDDLPPDLTRFLRIIERQSSRLQSIMEDLLNLARIEQPRMDGQHLDREMTAIRPVLAAAVELCEHNAQAKNVQIAIECDPQLQGWVHQVLLEQALVNLIDNAIKYGLADATITVSAGLDEGGSRLSITVADEGPGIAANHLPRLFERFYRVDKGRSRMLGGTGLGLAIVKHIALAHGGDVEVDSELGRGSVFRIHLPMAPEGVRVPADPGALRDLHWMRRSS